MSWIARYVGAPWRAGASGPHEYDCWGLVRAVYRERLGIELPAIEADALSVRSCAQAFSGAAERARWREIAAPRELCAVLLGRGTHAVHVGLWCEGAVLHAVRGAGVVHQVPASLRAHGWRILGYFERT